MEYFVWLAAAGAQGVEHEREPKKNQLRIVSGWGIASIIFKVRYQNDYN
jgi:hypothetical protein